MTDSRANTFYSRDGTMCDTVGNFSQAL